MSFQIFIQTSRRHKMDQSAQTFGAQPTFFMRICRPLIAMFIAAALLTVSVKPNSAQAQATDTTPPTANPTVSPAPNAAGWYNISGVVTVTWNWTDGGGSGIDPANCPSQTNITLVSLPVFVVEVCRDLAGNVGEAEFPVGRTDTNPPNTQIRQYPPAISNVYTATFEFLEVGPYDPPIFDPNALGGGWGEADASPLAGFECQLDGGGFSVCTSPLNLTGLADGSHTFQVRAKDLADNVDPTPSTITWTVDTTPPAANPAVSPAPNAAGWYNISGVVTVTWNWTDGDGGGIDPANCPSQTSVVLGSLSLVVVEICRDLAGNVGEAEFPVGTTDTNPPNTQIRQYPSAISNVSTATFEFLEVGPYDPPIFDPNALGGGWGEADASPLAGFECQIDGGGFSACTSPLNLTGLANGSHTFEVRAKDLADNVDPTPASYTWTIAVNSAPVAPDDAYTTHEDRPLTIAAPGVLGNDSDVDGDPLTVVLLDDVTDGQLILNSDGSFTYTPDPDFVESDVFSYKVNDGSADSNVVTVTIAVKEAFAVCGDYDVFETESGGYEAPDFAGVLIVGSDGDDLLIGTDGPDLILGLDGADDIAGAEEDDVICGGPGEDFIEGDEGHDDLFGDEDEDWLIGGDGEDFCEDESGEDTIEECEELSAASFALDNAATVVEEAARRGNDGEHNHQIFLPLVSTS